MKKEKRQEFVIKVGPLMKEAIEKQKKKVKEVTYGHVNPSDYEISEIIGEKLLNSNLI